MNLVTTFTASKTELYSPWNLCFSIFFKKISNQAKSLRIVHKSNNICKKYDFGNRTTLFVKLHY